LGEPRKKEVVPVTPGIVQEPLGPSKVFIPLLEEQLKDIRHHHDPSSHHPPVPRQGVPKFAGTATLKSAPHNAITLALTPWMLAVLTLRDP
jgi:hypothetical protein